VLNNLISKVYDTSDEKNKTSNNNDSIGKKIKIIFCSKLKDDFPGIGLDSSIIPLQNKNLYLVQSVDFFYPLCDDAKLMGKRAFPKSF
jgi:hypothetical protein